MKLFRTLVSVFLVLLGVMMIVTWAFGAKSVEAIENGTAAAKLTDKVLASPAVANLAADQVTDRVHQQLATQADSRRFEELWGLAEEPIHAAAENVIGSDAVATAAGATATKVQEGLVTALTAKDRAYGPLVLTVDVSARLNTRIGQIPLVGALLPDITAPTLEVEVLEADAVEDLRAVYSSATWVATWFIWIGLVLVALGVLVSPRRTWFLARAMLVAGVLVLAIGFTVDAIGAHTVASLMPGGADGDLGMTVSDVLADTAIPTVSRLLLRLGAIALALALIAALAVRYAPIFRDSAQSRRAQSDPPPVAPRGGGAVPVQVANNISVQVADGVLMSTPRMPGAVEDRPVAADADVRLVHSSPLPAVVASAPASIPAALPVRDGGAARKAPKKPAPPATE